MFENLIGEHRFDVADAIPVRYASPGCVDHAIMYIGMLPLIVKSNVPAKVARLDRNDGKME